MDLNRRNCTDIKINYNNKVYFVEVNVPLAKLDFYSSEFRKLTSGNGTYSLEFNSYQKVSQKEYNELLIKKKLIV